jgi:hypothetical protein
MNELSDGVICVHATTKGRSGSILGNPSSGAAAPGAVGGRLLARHARDLSANPHHPVRAGAAAFEVADYDAIKATREREGIAYVENTQPGGRIQMLCNDLDGNTLEFQPATV